MSRKPVREINDATPTLILIEEFKNGIGAISEYLRDISRSPESVKSEELLLARGNVVVPDLILLFKPGSSDAVRFFTIELLAKFGTKEAFERLLLTVGDDQSPTCRYTALTKFSNITDPEAIKSLVHSMKQEVLTNHFLADQEKTAGIVKSILEVMTGRPPRVLTDRIFKGIAGKIAHKMFVEPLKTNMSKLKPLERLALFADAYRFVLLSSPTLSFAELMKLTQDSSEHVRAFMAREWLASLLSHEQLSGVRPSVVAATLALTRDPNAKVKDLALAALVTAGTPETELAVQQLANSSNSLRNVIQKIRQQQSAKP